MRDDEASKVGEDSEQSKRSEGTAPLQDSVKPKYYLISPSPQVPSPHEKRIFLSVMTSRLQTQSGTFIFSKNNESSIKASVFLAGTKATDNEFDEYFSTA